MAIVNEVHRTRAGTTPRRRGRARLAVSVIAASLVVVACVAPPPDTSVPDPGPRIVEPVPDDSEQVRGYLDAHNHLFSDAAFGGRLLCGKVWHPDGIATALRDCDDHYPQGQGALFEMVTRPSTAGGHDPAGWPTFADWPAHDSLTHQQNYWEWIQRAWEGGLRLMVNHIVTNRELCEFWPLRDQPCDPMTSVRLQAQMTRDLEAYIDEQWGGPGKGWFRVVESSEEARAVIAEGKLAVVLGVEVSEPFGCRLTGGAPTCTEADIDRGLDEVYDLGVRTMFLCHKFDNALCGVRLDGGAIGLVINLGNALSTGSFWRTEPCAAEAADNVPLGAGVIEDWMEPLLRPGDPLPLYGDTPHCNQRGLSDLGEYALRGMMERGMLVEIDHMSAKAAEQTLQILEAEDYPGVVSSHSWVDPVYYDRIYALGGMAVAYGSPADEFVEEWKASQDLREAHGVVGFGFGIDGNGFGGLAGPRQSAATRPLEYPFEALDGRSMDRATTGLREWDLNGEGMAHYGLLADLAADVARVGGPEVAESMAAGAEQYLLTLGSAESHG